MIPIVEERFGELQQLCIRCRVLRLDLFGSAAAGNYHGRESDLDFLVDCPRENTPTPTSGCWRLWNCSLDTR